MLRTRLLLKALDLLAECVPAAAAVAAVSVVVDLAVADSVDLPALVHPALVRD